MYSVHVLVCRYKYKIAWNSDMFFFLEFNPLMKRSGNWFNI
jgi:hypothetical protein